jgi:hypothetical protein
MTVPAAAQTPSQWPTEERARPTLSTAVISLIVNVVARLLVRQVSGTALSRHAE